MNYRIQEITIEGLFGMFDHHIPLNQNERITIVYGVNGIGKTMIMRMVDALFNQEFWKLGKLPFEHLILNFSEGNYLKISKKTKEEIFYINYKINDNKEADFELPLKRNYLHNTTDFGQLTAYITSTYSNWHRIDGLNLYDSNKGKAWSVTDFMDEYTHLLPAAFQPNFNIPQDLSELFENFSTYFIPTERLSTLDTSINQYTEYFTAASDRTIESVLACSLDLVNKIQAAKDAYNNLSRQLEVSLGKRLIDKQVNTNYSYEQLVKQAKVVQTRQNELRNVGLVNGMASDDFVPDKSMDEVSKAIIAVNFQDIQLKLGVFDDIYEKLKLFINILNERRLSFKKIKISSERGFVFKDDNGVELTPDQLSSGEQHEVILLYQLLFEVPENALVMIDEPEISHHIVWKQKFVEDMEDIIELRNFDAYINTHSPSIVNGNWDITISLTQKSLVEEEV